LLQCSRLGDAAFISGFDCEDAVCVYQVSSLPTPLPSHSAFSIHHRHHLISSPIRSGVGCGFSHDQDLVRARQRLFLPARGLPLHLAFLVIPQHAPDLMRQQLNVPSLVSVCHHSPSHHVPFPATRLTDLALLLINRPVNTCPLLFASI
jgi:hypothetical protein